MKKLFVFLIMLLVSIISLGYTSINFSFIFTFGSTNTTYSQYVKLRYINDSSISTITFFFKTYPQNIKINSEEFVVYSKNQKFVTGSGKIFIEYKNNKYEFLLENEEINLGLDQDVIPNIKIISYTKKVSPNNDWYNDSLKILLYSNTYGYIKFNNLNVEKQIRPGKNELYFPIDYPDGYYKDKLTVYNEKGSFSKEIDFEVDRSKKTATKYILLSLLGLFIGFIGYTILNK
ncbi:hypothetical protein [Marinitoga aeolica]|uniref:Uncharacterized protein n=1 Tax=Marinitoga aeolica TaxID=2809031 RepID=A0ABY8PPS4_9BACT|nr:hypothetical protein [Marinitoga aeolica]WGS64642.1 hypothetical protein JRV97_09785 [Marinitoga aeolica]